MIAEPAPTFALRLASAADPRALEAWLAGSPEKQAIYASGIDLPRDAAGVRLVVRWREMGLVTTTQARDPADRRRWQFIVEKIQDAPGNEPGAQVRATASGYLSAGVRGRARQAHRLSARAEKLLALLRTAAVEGAPCPSFAEAARALGLPRDERGKQSARYLFHRLERSGAIAMVHGGPAGRRVATIRAKGKGMGLSTAKANRHD